MAERVIASRKSQLFLHTVIPVTNTRDEVVQAKLRRGKFPWTVTGCLQLGACVLLIATLALFVSKQSCENSSDWRQFLLPATSGITLVITLAFYLIFSCGFSVKKPGAFVATDTITLLLLSLLEIASCVATMLDCAGFETMKKVPEIIGIIASVILLASCASFIIMYRYREFEDDDDEEERKQEERKRQIRQANAILSRKSIAA